MGRDIVDSAARKALVVVARAAGAREHPAARSRDPCPCSAPAAQPLTSPPHLRPTQHRHLPPPRLRLRPLPLELAPPRHVRRREHAPPPAGQRAGEHLGRAVGSRRRGGRQRGPARGWGEGWGGGASLPSVNSAMSEELKKCLLAVIRRFRRRGPLLLRLESLSFPQRCGSIQHFWHRCTAQGTPCTRVSVPSCARLVKLMLIVSGGSAVAHRCQSSP